MRLPNKVTLYQESVLSKLNVLLDVVCNRDLSLTELYSVTQKNFSDMAEFIDALDVLFALNKLEYNDELEVLHYVG